MKKTSSLVLLYALLFLSMNLHASNRTTICLTGRLESALPIYKPAFVNAAKLSISENNLTEEINLKVLIYDNKPLSAIRNYKKLMKYNCSAIIGYEYLADLLLISKNQHKKIPIFATYASTSEYEKLPDNVFIFIPPYEFMAKKMFQFLKNKFGTIQKVIVITEIDRPDLERYRSAYTEILKKQNIPYETLDYVGSDNFLDAKIKSHFSSTHYDFVFLLTSAVGSTKIINLTNDHKIIFVGTENFGSSSNQSLYVRLENKNVNAYSIRNFDFINKKHSINLLVKKFTQTYSASPNPLSIYTYDAMNIILTSLKKSGRVTMSNILNTEFEGLSGVKIKNKIFDRSKNYIILSIGANGFKYEK